MEEKTYIVILNYNNWQDTIECLESVLRNDYSNYQVIVVDNNSPDNSMEYIKDWLEGKLDVWLHPKNPLKHLSFPPLKKPIPYVEYTKEQAEKRGFPEKEESLKGDIPEGVTTKYPVVLIQAGENRGFSTGNNIGIKYALAKDDFEYVWLLNNDTVIEKSTLVNLINCAKNLDDKTSPIGTVLLYYDEPDKIQALGGKFNKFVGAGYHIFANKKYIKEKVEKFLNEKNIDYVVGASMFFKKNFFKEVGLLNEEYFIYFEEIDIAVRGKRKGYKLGICLDSIVYHKEGSTINKKQVTQSEFSDFFAMRNRKIFTKKYNPFYLPFVYTTYIISIIRRIKRKEYKKALNIIKIILGKENYE